MPFPRLQISIWYEYIDYVGTEKDWYCPIRVSQYQQQLKLLGNAIKNSTTKYMKHATLVQVWLGFVRQQAITYVNF